MTIKKSVLAICLGVGAILLSGQPSNAGNSDKCVSQVELPQNKEELELSDVTRAVNSHLLRLGVSGQTVDSKWESEDIILASISHRGNLLRQIKVDAATAAIIERRNYGRAVGFEAPKYWTSLVRPDLFMQKVRYSRQLRRHMLGDGEAWTNWVGKQPGLLCLDDYRFGGPRMDEPGS